MKIHSKICLSVIILVLFVYNAMAQSIFLNHEKYWFYRYNLKTKFMRIGKESGESIPAAIRRINTDCTFNIVQFRLRLIVLFSCCIGINHCNLYFIYGLKYKYNWYNVPVFNHTAIIWADATVDLGNYILMLATEYELLRKNNRNTDSTELEIYYAIRAISRLDSVAEHALYNQHTTAFEKNGFLIRDDVPLSFVSNFPDMNVVNSNFIDATTQKWIEDGRFNGEMSQDQMIGLLFGLSFLYKYIDGTLVIKGMNIKNETNDIIDRLVTYLKEEDYLLKRPVDGNTDSSCNETIFLFDSEKNEMGWVKNGVWRGCNARYTSKGFAEAAKLITGNTYYRVLPDTTDTTGILTRNLLYIVPIGQEMWNILKNAYLFPKIQGNEIESDNICISTRVIIVLPGLNIPVPINVTKCFEKIKLNDFAISNILKLAAISSTWSRGEVKNNADAFNMQMYTLAKDVKDDIHDPPDRSIYSDILGSAPCIGPHFNGPGGDAAPEGWRVPYRWSSPTKAITGEPEHKIFFGEYNGLDYMQLFNFYQIAYSNTPYVLTYANLIDRKLTGELPIVLPSSGIVIGDKANPIKIIGFNSIHAENLLIKPDADATFKASKEITLGSGFEVQEGANFEAIVEPIVCTQTGFYGKKGATSELTDAQQSELMEVLTPKVKHKPIANKPKPVMEEENELTAFNIPREFMLFNFPNPFKDITDITYTVVNTGNVNIFIKDFYGREISHLVNNETKQPGCYKLTYDASNLHPGIYYYTLQSGYFVETRKMVVVK